MKTSNLLIVICAGAAISCAATVPMELVDAREAYRRASFGTAGQAAPAELHVANQALAEAEQSFKKDPHSYRTLDLAYVAQRKAQIAEATASIAIQNKKEADAKNDFETTQGKVVAKTKQALNQTRTALAASERSGEATAQQLSTEQIARAAAEQRAADSQAALAKLAAVKDEPRGMVITLSGSVLFASNRAVLLPEARARLDQVAEVLLTNRERNLTVEGYTDSRGSVNYNLDLSQRRADAVRSYLVERGYQGDLIKAHGLGKDSPVADNSSAEGRANNRRVEIVIAHEPHASNP
jgi:outer membrane protein OmpA-like peptidoglycan-associated protein